MHNIKTVTAAIIIKNEKILICRRANGEKLAGLWEFPGGKLENGESLQQGLERELSEELGVRSRADIVLGRSRYTYDHGEFEVVGIQTELLDFDIKLSVHDASEWVSLNELMSYRLAPADILLAEALIKT